MSHDEIDIMLNSLKWKYSASQMTEIYRRLEAVDVNRLSLEGYLTSRYNAKPVPDRIFDAVKVFNTGNGSAHRSWCQLCDGTGFVSIYDPKVMISNEMWQEIFSRDSVYFYPSMATKCPECNNDGLYAAYWQSLISSQNPAAMSIASHYATQKGLPVPSEMLNLEWN